MAITLQLTASYENTDFTRNYTFTVPNTIAPDVKRNIIAINESLFGGTSGGLNEFFVSDDGDNLQLFTAAKFIRIDEEPITIAPAND